jgi:hypothetical protein
MEFTFHNGILGRVPNTMIFQDIAQLAISVSILLYKQTNLVFVVFHCLFENLFFLEFVS